MRNTIYALGLLACVGLGLAWPGTIWTAEAEPVLKASVNYADQVPQDLFGGWLRTRHIEKASIGDVAGTTEEGRWTIFRDGHRIILQNPDSGAETEVTVENVFKSTAVFNYNKQVGANRWCHEQLTLTPGDNGRTLDGFQVKECYQSKLGEKVSEPYYQVFARVTGVRNQVLPPL